MTELSLKKSTEAPISLKATNKHSQGKKSVCRVCFTGVKGERKKVFPKHGAHILAQTCLLMPTDISWHQKGQQGQLRMK